MGPKLPNVDRKYLENGKSQRYMSNGPGCDICSARAFQKCIEWDRDGSPQGSPGPYKEKYVFFARGQISRADRRENLHDGRT